MSVPEIPEYLPEIDVRDAAEPTTLRAVALLLRDLANDPRVPWQAKVVAAGAAVYVAPGVRAVVPRVPLAPILEPLALIAALRYLVAAAGYEVVRELWRGDDAGFLWLLVLTGIDR